MPTRRVKNSERRRCARACTTCKRRKERCDGAHPCGRCVGRRVAHDCTFDSSPRPLRSPLTTPDSSSSNIHVDIDQDHRTASEGGTIRHASRGADSILGTSSLPQPFPSPREAPVPQMSRLIQDGRGKFMYIGDAANLSFLQTIRRLISDFPWASPFTDDPMRHSIVEAAPPCSSRWILNMIKNPPQKPSHDEAMYYARWYLLATNFLVGLFDETELHHSMSAWLGSMADGLDQDPRSAIFFLVFAIGAQTCPDNRDDIAEKYFNYGRFLTASTLIDDPSIPAIQANTLIAIYLLGASRRNAAFMSLGTAVRAAYALGIHRGDTNAFFDPAEYALRERLWKVVRVLDLFMSASLGRPPSTSETRDTKSDVNYSATTDLCAMFETILTQVYSKRMVSTELVENISQHHRQWSAKFGRGLDADGIHPDEFVNTDDSKKILNLGLHHLKEAYYWTIMLLSRPFLVESVSNTLAQASAQARNEESATPHSPSDQVLSHACVDSAIRTVDLSRTLIAQDDVPKRLPLVVNSLFISGLVLGLAHFGDLDRVFPLGESLASVAKMLSFFSPHDAVANRDLVIIKSLQASCASYLNHRARRKMARQSLLIGGLFGTVHAANNSAGSLTGGGPGGPAGQEEQDGFSSMERTSPAETNADRFDRPWQENMLADGSQGVLDPSDTMSGLHGPTSITDAMLPMSPRTLMFDSFDNIIPLFSTVDGTLLPFENGAAVDEGSDLGCAG